MELKTCTGTFQFGPDFYQPSARVSLTANGAELFLRWPSGGDLALIPLGRDHFVDRSYWVEVTIERDASATFRSHSTPESVPSTIRTLKCRSPNCGNIFLRILRERVFQHPRLFSTVIPLLKCLR